MCTYMGMALDISAPALLFSNSTQKLQVGGTRRAPGRRPGKGAPRVGEAGLSSGLAGIDHTGPI